MVLGDVALMTSGCHRRGRGFQTGGQKAFGHMDVGNGHALGCSQNDMG